MTEEETQDEEQLTPEAIAELKTKATKAEELEKAIAERDAKIKELDEEESRVNFRKARKQIEAMNKALKKEGKILDEETDEVKSLAKEFSEEDIDKRAEIAAERVLINKSLAKAQKGLSDEDKAIFSKYYEKASHGETVTSDNVDEIIDQAWRMAGTTNSSKSIADRAAGTRGGAPREEPQGKSYADTPEGQEVYNRLFPNYSPKKK